MNKFGYLLAGLALAAFVSGQAQAQSAKFAATWDNTPIVTTATSTCTDGNCTGNDDNTDIELEMATIHIATHKSVLIGVSAQIGIILVTEAKGKGGGDCNPNDCSSTAFAKGSVNVGLTLIDPDSGAVCIIAPSASVILKSEARTLKVDAESSDSEIAVFVSIATESISANTFNFLGVECDQGHYKLTATFTDRAIAEAFGLDSLANVTVTLGQRLITMQEVRAVKGSLVEDPTSGS